MPQHAFLSSINAKSFELVLKKYQSKIKFTKKMLPKAWVTAMDNYITCDSTTIEHLFAIYQAATQPYTKMQLLIFDELNSFLKSPLVHVLCRLNQHGIILSIADFETLCRNEHNDALAYLLDIWIENRNYLKKEIVGTFFISNVLNHQPESLKDVLALLEQLSLTFHPELESHLSALLCHPKLSVILSIIELLKIHHVQLNQNEGHSLINKIKAHQQLDDLFNTLQWMSKNNFFNDEDYSLFITIICHEHFNTIFQLLDKVQCANIDVIWRAVHHPEPHYLLTTLSALDSKGNWDIDFLFEISVLICDKPNVAQYVKAIIFLKDIGIVRDDLIQQWMLIITQHAAPVQMCKAIVALHEANMLCEFSAPSLLALSKELAVTLVHLHQYNQLNSLSLTLIKKAKDPRHLTHRIVSLSSKGLITNELLKLLIFEKNPLLLIESLFDISKARASFWDLIEPSSPEHQASFVKGSLVLHLHHLLNIQYFLAILKHKNPFSLAQALINMNETQQLCKETVGLLEKSENPLEAVLARLELKQTTGLTRGMTLKVASSTPGLPSNLGLFSCQNLDSEVLETEHSNIRTM